jgi:hypothetical protein
MNHPVTKLVIVSVLAAFGESAAHAAPATPASQESKKEQSGKQKPQPAASLNGCIDEQQGKYVLVDERDLNLIADLVADGFPTEGFAKHVGHKVIVRGVSGPDSAHPVFRVRSIETVSEVCAPHAPQEDKK